jgi:hypothetical protein
MIYMPEKKAAAKPKAKTKPIAQAKPKAKTKPKAQAKTTKFFRTGEKCPESGLYEHFCKEKGDGARIPLSKSETFPPCRTCGSVKWKLIMSAN